MFSGHPVWSLTVNTAKGVPDLERPENNTERPHSALGNLTPIAYAARNASVPQQAGALRLPEGFAPRPAATPDLTGPNDALNPENWIVSG